MKRRKRKLNINGETVVLEAVPGRLKREKWNAFSVFILVFLSIYTISILAMYFWAFYTSLKTHIHTIEDYLAFPKGWPWEWAWDNYTTALSEIKVFVMRGNFRKDVYIDEMLLNSVLFALGGAFVSNITCWLVSYLIAKFYRYKLSKALYVINIAVMNIPLLGTLPSALRIFRMFGWYDNYWFILFNNIGFTGMYLLVYVTFIKTIGKEFYESAYMDGAGNFTIMTRIVFPLTSSMFFVVLLLYTITRWNDYMTMIVWMPNYPTLAYGIYKATHGGENTLSSPNTQIAVCMVLMIPMLILFAFFKKPMMSNLKLGAIK